MTDVNIWKEKGNALFRDKNYLKAWDCYNQAIKHIKPNTPDQHLIYGNRSLTLISMGEYPLALEDALKCIKLSVKWPKGYYRAALSLCNLERYDEAMKNIEMAIGYDSQDKTFKDLKDTILKRRKELQKSLKDDRNSLHDLEGSSFSSLMLGSYLQPFGSLSKTQKEKEEYMEMIRDDKHSMRKFIKLFDCPSLFGGVMDHTPTPNKRPVGTQEMMALTAFDKMAEEPTVARRIVDSGLSHIIWEFSLCNSIEGFGQTVGFALKIAKLGMIPHLIVNHVPEQMARWWELTTMECDELLDELANLTELFLDCTKNPEIDMVAPHIAKAIAAYAKKYHDQKHLPHHIFHNLFNSYRLCLDNIGNSDEPDERVPIFEKDVLFNPQVLAFIPKALDHFTAELNSFTATETFLLFLGFQNIFDGRVKEYTKFFNNININTFITSYMLVTDMVMKKGYMETAWFQFLNDMIHMPKLAKKFATAFVSVDSRSRSKAKAPFTILISMFETLIKQPAQGKQQPWYGVSVCIVMILHYISAPAFANAIKHYPKLISIVLPQFLEKSVGLADYNYAVDVVSRVILFHPELLYTQLDTNPTPNDLHKRFTTILGLSKREKQSIINMRSVEACLLLLKDKPTKSQ